MARKLIWRQMIADVMNSEVVCMQEEEAAALGGANPAYVGQMEKERTEFFMRNLHSLRLKLKTYPTYHR